MLSSAGTQEGGWKECQPQQFSRDERFRPIGMLATDSLFRELPSEFAHLKCQQHALFP